MQDRQTGKPAVPFKAVVLAGERPGGSAFSRELGLPASVLVDVAGRSAVSRVIEALEHSESVSGGFLCGPDEAIVRANPEFAQVLAGSGFEWLAPAAGPSASAQVAVRELDHFPALITAGDHALLTPAIVDDFCSRARTADADIVVGLAPYEIVRSAFPYSRRTVSRFRDGQFCGTNLFALLTPEALAGPAFWSRLEADRKKPWRMARKIGLGLSMRYVFGRLTLIDALQALSRVMGCRVGYLLMDQPRVAVDVDSIADRDLAEKVLLASEGEQALNDPPGAGQGNQP